MVTELKTIESRLTSTYPEFLSAEMGLILFVSLIIKKCILEVFDVWHFSGVYDK